jgi:hypothetical protein
MPAPRAASLGRAPIEPRTLFACRLVYVANPTSPYALACGRRMKWSSIKIMDRQLTNEDRDARSDASASANMPPVVRRRVQSVSAASIGALAIGALALGAIAIGALGIGRAAVGALSVTRSRVRSLAVEDLDVGRLHVRELVIDRELAGSRRNH